MMSKRDSEDLEKRESKHKNLHTQSNVSSIFMVGDKVTLDRYSAAMAGEFFVLAQLFLRGYDAALTYGHAKSVDILLYTKSERTYRLEVKTTRMAEPKTTKLYGNNYEWRMSSKHETIKDPNLFYCFVRLHGTDRMPLFFIVESKKVANYLKREHQRWIRTNPKTRGGSEKYRNFRIGLDEGSHGLRPPEKYGWDNLPGSLKKSS